MATAFYPPGELAPVVDTDRTAPPAIRSLPAFVKDKVKKYGAEDKDSDWRMFARYVVVEKFFQGEQFGRLSKIDGSWRVRPRKDGDPRYVHNLIRGHARGILSQWTQARTELVVIPLPDGDAPDDAKGAARAAEAMLDHYQRRLLTEDFRQRETMSAMTTGQMFRYSYWDKNAGENYARRPQWGMEEAMSPAAFQCLDCGEGGEGEGACPSCGSLNVNVDEPQAYQIPTIAGYDTVSLGDLCCVPVPGYQLKYDRIPFRFKDSQWLRWRVYLRPEAVREIIPDYKKPIGGEQDDWGFRAEQTLKKTTGNTEASGARVYGQNSNRSDAELITVDRWWFKPAVYKDFVLQEPLKTLGGEDIPAGTRAIDVFPEGLYVLLLDNEPRDYRNELFTDHWQHTPAVLLPSRIDGDGLLDDLIEPQREFNDVEGLKLANIKYVCGSGLILRSEWLDRADVGGKPFEIAVVKPGTPPEVKNTDIITPIPRVPLPAEVYQYSQQQQEQMQWMASTYSTSVGAPDVSANGGAGTATGASLLSQAARSQRAPELALRAAGDVECAEQWLRLIQKNLTDETFFPYAAKFEGKTGMLDGQWFKNSDLPTKFAVTLRPRSYIPKGENERRADFMALIAAFGGIEGLMAAIQSFPELVQEACERFNVTLDLSGTNLAAQVARLRLEAMKAMLPAAQQTAQQFGDLSFAIQVLTTSDETSVDPDDDHAAMIRFYVRWKSEDEGQEARVKNKLLYAAVNAQIQNHKIGGVAQAQEQGQMQIAAQAPQMELQQQQMAQQQAIGQEQADNQNAEAERQRQFQASESAADRRHKEGLSERQMAHAAAMSQADRENALAQAKMRAK